MRKVEINFVSLYELAQKNGDVDALDASIFTLYQLYRNSYELRKLLHSKVLGSEQKIEILKSLPCFEPSKTFYTVVYLLLEREIVDRIYYLSEGFSKVVNQKLGRIIVHTFSAQAISGGLKAQLTSQLEGILSKKVVLKNSVDPTLVGGFIVKLPDRKIYDFTVKRILSDYKFYLMEKN